MATHSSIPAWKIPWTEEPGRLQSMGSQEFWFQLFELVWIECLISNLKNRYATNHKVFLYSIENYSQCNYSQYLVITYDGKIISKIIYVYLYNWITLLCTWNIVNYTSIKYTYICIFLKKRTNMLKLKEVHWSL